MTSTFPSPGRGGRSRRSSSVSRVWGGGLLLLCVCATVRGGWPSERTVGPFLVHATFDVEGIAPLLESLVALERDVRSTLELAPLAEPVHLFLFSDEGSYSAYLRRHFPGVPGRKAIFVKTEGPGMVFAYRSAELATDLRHETTHAILHGSLRIVPLWLDEGLAEYFESPPSDRVSASPHLSGTVWNARFGLIPPISKLAACRDITEMGLVEYRGGWAWVHFCLHHSPATREELIGYLADRNAGRFTDELEPRLARRVGDLRAAIGHHFLSWR